MIEVVVKSFENEVLVQRPGRESTLRIERSTGRTFAEIYFTNQYNESCFDIVFCSPLKQPADEYSVSQLRELYRDYVGEESE